MERPIVFAKARAARRGAEKVPAPGSTVQKLVANTRSSIAGVAVGSSYEANVADALEILGWAYSYQYSVKGGRRRRGGIVLDFLVHTRPAWTPLWVNGAYWHKRRSAVDEMQQANLSSYMRFPVRDSLVMWDADCLTVDAAYNFLFQKIGRA